MDPMGCVGIKNDHFPYNEGLFVDFDRPRLLGLTKKYQKKSLDHHHLPAQGCINPKIIFGRV